jgi:hypothetical protein
MESPLSTQGGCKRGFAESAVQSFSGKFTAACSLYAEPFYYEVVKATLPDS